ncbi:MAG: SGNH/GDSL hydrolase family protein [Planctomycetes bacterium]|nr:SGNH/GDSL hydrolase family protein [Planctomycetota bacterium]
MRHDIQSTRRSFLGASLAAAGGIGAAGCASTAAAPQRRSSLLTPNCKVLFQGDSITDAGRDRNHADQPNAQAALGDGYAWFAAAGLLTAAPTTGLRVWNRGVSGNKVFQLAERWQADCLALVPDVLSILIGVNDLWHAKNGEYQGTVAIYERDYDALLARTRQALPSVQIVVCEPFVLRCGAVKDTWFPEFDHYRAAARRVADRHGARWVPFQAMFDAALAYAPPAHWAGDGVHPSAAGAALMAQTWRDVVEGRATVR